MSDVYVLLDSKNRIIAVDGGYTMPADLTGWVKIDSGDGDRYNLCQTHYFPDGILTENGTPLYVLEDGVPILRSENEVQAEMVKNNHLSEIEMLKKQIEAQNAVLDFYEECIVEMAAIVYA